MYRTIAACAITSAVTFAVAATTGLAGGAVAFQSVRLAVGESAHFAANNLLCVNEPVGDGGLIRSGSGLR
jgi:hypothetical protein